MAASGAFSASTSKKIEKLTCTICLELFQSPRLLPCHHTFCLPCLHDLAARHNNTRFPCPSCMKIFPVPQGGVQEFQVNFYIEDDLEEVLEAEKRASGSSSQPPAPKPWNTRGEARDSLGRQHSNQQKDRSPFSQRYNVQSTPNQDYIIQAFKCVCSVVTSVGDVLLWMYLSLIKPFPPLGKMFLTLIVGFCLVSILGKDITFYAILLALGRACMCACMRLYNCIRLWRDGLFRDGRSGQSRVVRFKDVQDYIIQAFKRIYYIFVCSVVMSVGDVLLCMYLSLMDPFPPLCKMFLTLIVYSCLVSLLGPDITFYAILLGFVAYCKRQM